MARYDKQAIEIEGMISRLQDDKHAWQNQLEDAISAEVRAEGAVDAARDLQRRAQTAILDDDDEINRLLDELPGPRQPSP